MADLQLRERDARLVYLAAVYHLGRPGSELDSVSHLPQGLGLGELREDLRARLEGPEEALVSLALGEYQLTRLGEALLGLVNELKQVALSGRSVVPGFMEALALALPGEITPEETGAALDVAGEVTLLRRRLGAAIREAEAAIERARVEQAEAAVSPRPWWKVWPR